jgi:glycosyltransferase involved in cell wall biosynthesis
LEPNRSPGGEMSPNSQNSPTISIVTPSFNQGAYLEETILSVLNQNYEPLEYIVIDGGSSDNSVEIIRTYKDRLAFWISEPDKGQTSALNKGFRKATGDIIAYLNSDDLYQPGALARVAAEFSAPECHWLSGTCLFFDETGTKHHERRPPPVLRSRWFDHCWLSQPAVFWRRDLFDQVGLFDETLHYGMDYDFWMRLVMAGERCRFIDEPVAAFRWHSLSKTTAQTEGFSREEDFIRKKYVSALPAHERLLARHFARVAESKRCHEEIRSLIESGQRAAALKLFAKTVANYPPGILTRSWITTAARLLS